MGNFLSFKKPKMFVDASEFLEYINKKDKTRTTIQKDTTERVVNNLQSIIHNEVNAKLWITSIDKYDSNPYNQIMTIPVEYILNNTVNVGILYREIGHFKYYKQSVKLQVINSSLFVVCSLASASFGLLSRLPYLLPSLLIFHMFSSYKIERYIEKKCDLYACERGYNKELQEYFEDTINLDKILRNDNWYNWLRISEKGNDRFDFRHPSITTRIEYITNFDRQI